MTPQAFRWEGDSFVPLRPKYADRELVVGRVYWLTEVRNVEPSGRSWRHMFAVIKKSWENLPEDLKDDYPTPEALRKRALIQAGFYDETVIEVSDTAAAGLLAAVLRRRNGLSHVIVRPGCVIQREAKSQKDMEREEFQRSKDAIFGIVSDLIGVDIATLERES